MTTEEQQSAGSQAQSPGGIGTSSSSTMEGSNVERPTMVLIVGAGLAGIMLAMLLEKIDVPYTIFERSSQVRPLGSALSLNANILPVFEQLGLLDEIMKMSLDFHEQVLHDADLNKIASLGYSQYFHVTGYKAIVFSRPKLYELMISKIPAEKILYNKKVMSLEQNQLGAMIRCSDGTTYHGDIIVGADGAYSGVRQALYKYLDKKKLLPEEDKKSLDVCYVTMVGVTKPMDPEKYPVLKEPRVDFSLVVGGQYHTWNTISIPENKFCWSVRVQVTSSSTSKEQQFRNSEWGPEANDAMIKEFRDRPLPVGGTLGDMIDATPRELISKVYLEEKLFETWHYGRTALIGDACHKMLPAGGMGAVNAMLDAVVLANCIYEMNGDYSLEKIKEALDDYRGERYPLAKGSCESSSKVAKLMYGQTWTEKLFRHLVFNCLPESFLAKGFAKTAAYRPQAYFLPQVENRGAGAVASQRPCKRPQTEKAKSESENADPVAAF